MPNITISDVTVSTEPSTATIAPNLRADLMRKQMESKNTLQHKGSTYVGTGYVDSSTGVCGTLELEAKDANNKHQGILAVVPDTRATGSEPVYKLGYYSPFSFTNGVLTITYYTED